MGKSINDMQLPDFGNMAKGMVQGPRTERRGFIRLSAVNTGIHSREMSLLRMANISYRIR